MYSVKVENINTGKIYYSRPMKWRRICWEVRKVIISLTSNGLEEGIDFDAEIIDAEEIPADYNPNEDWN